MHARIANLTYDAGRQKLTGSIGAEKPFDITAYSGGSRGHKQVDKKTAILYRHFEEKNFSSHFANSQTIGEGTRKDPYKRGGTLPSGHYSCTYLENHKPFGECIYLNRDADAHPLSDIFRHKPRQPG